MTNVVCLAKGHGIAMALAPQMQAIDPEAARIIDNNMGIFGTEAEPLADGVGAVHSATR